MIEQELEECRKIYGMVCAKALERAKHEGLDKEPRLN